jgi:hypothetical protein
MYLRDLVVLAIPNPWPTGHLSHLDADLVQHRHWSIILCVIFGKLPPRQRQLK